MTSTMSWPHILSALVGGDDLSSDQARWAMDSVMNGSASPVQLAGFLVALRAKGETVDELTGLANGMLANAVEIDIDRPCVDIVGTGGDRAHTVNISTMSALVIAGAGPLVVKHGNRAASSSSGSADVLEVLGVNLSLAADRVEQIAAEVGITFCFAAAFHPSMRHAGQTRKELGIPTTFNFLGPLTNPARPRAMALGVADERMAPLMAGVLAERGVSALVFRGTDGLDELAATGPAQVWHVDNGDVTLSIIDPVSDLGSDPITVEDLRGGSPQDNAAVFRQVLAGLEGPVRQTVLLNAAAGLVADGTLPGTGAADGTLPERLKTAMAHAAESIDSGRANGMLDRWIAATQNS